MNPRGTFDGIEYRHQSARGARGTSRSGVRPSRNPGRSCDTRTRRDARRFHGCGAHACRGGGWGARLPAPPNLCTSAGLNRGTFYNHFRDKESLLASFEDEVIEGLGGVLAKFQNIKLRELAACSLTHRPLPMLVELYDYLREEGPFLHAMLGPGGDARFGMRLREAVCGRFVRSLLHERYQNDPSAFTRYYISFYSGAYLGVISEWIDSGMTETSEEMALISMRLLFIKPGESIKM